MFASEKRLHVPTRRRIPRRIRSVLALTLTIIWLCFTFSPWRRSTTSHRWPLSANLFGKNGRDLACLVGISPPATSQRHDNDSVSINVTSQYDRNEPPQYSLRVAKVTFLTYNKTSNLTKTYEKALLSHDNHNARFRYKHFVLRRDLVPGMWNKVAYLMELLLQELGKPVEKRIEWLFWHDADIVLTNSKLALESFLPPVDGPWSHIQQIITNDQNGLNAGVFFLRVHPWAFEYLSAVMAYKENHPDAWMPYDEQSAMQFLIREEARKHNVTHIPQRWINAYHDFGDPGDVPPEWEWSVGGRHKLSDLLIHLPGTGGFREMILKEWMERIKTKEDQMEKSRGDMPYAKDIATFWDADSGNGAVHEEATQDRYWIRKELLAKVGYDYDRKREGALKKYADECEEKGVPEGDRKEENARISKEWDEKKIVALREGEKEKWQEREVQTEEKKKKKSEDDKKKAEEEKKKAEEEKRKAEEAKKAEEEKKTKPEDDKKKPEDQNKAEEEKKVEEPKKTEEQKKTEDDKKKAEEEKKKNAGDDKKAEDEKKNVEEEKKAEEEKKKVEEEDKKSEEEDKKDEDAKKGEEEPKTKENETNDKVGEDKQPKPEERKEKEENAGEHKSQDPPKGDEEKKE